jgi:rhodanese-related sulfurtransferase
MKVLLFIILTGITFNVISQSKKEFVCTPCGYDCDKEVHDGPGTCHSCNMKLIEKSSIKFSNITVDELCKRIAANPNALLLDVRTSGEFNGTITGKQSFGHFKNAININVEELESRIGELDKYKEREILVYCSHNHRSPRASYLLSIHGFKQVKNMTGGVSTFSEPENTCLKKSFVFHKN